MDEQPLYVSSNCLLVKALKYEPVGHAFHYAALKLLGCEKDDTAEVDDQNISIATKEKRNLSLMASNKITMHCWG